MNAGIREARFCNLDGDATPSLFSSSLPNLSAFHSQIACDIICDQGFEQIICSHMVNVGSALTKANTCFVKTQNVGLVIWLEVSRLNFLNRYGAVASSSVKKQHQCH